MSCGPAESGGPVESSDAGTWPAAAVVASGGAVAEPEPDAVSVGAEREPGDCPVASVELSGDGGRRSESGTPVLGRTGIRSIHWPPRRSLATWMPKS